MSSKKSMKETPVAQVSMGETQAILESVLSSISIEGDFVEFGCFRGDTSVKIAKILPQTKQLYLYDSFAGLPEKSAQDNSAIGENFKAGELLATKKDLVERFKKLNLRKPVIKKGFFNELDEKRDLPEKIAWAFLDGDLYESIKTSLKLIENHLSCESVILVHDYANPALPGVAKAVEEWLKEIAVKQKQSDGKEILAYRKKIRETLLILQPKNQG